VTHTVTLTPDEEQQLHRAAEKRGQDTDALVREAILQMLVQNQDTPDEDLPAPGESLYDAMKDYIGMFQSGGETTWSENTGEKFTEGLLEKKSQGRL
jgi:hypothetical protein